MNNQNVLQTEFNFILPKSLIDTSGKVHRQGVMRLATARNEICVQQDHVSKKTSLWRVES
ncbi:hypothetical protein NIES4103_11250 [Nostoc sp. NIES-4103]|nr:hypothetical protein NIES4103_11250 [Nostoc sp. NIES-4103]